MTQKEDQYASFERKIIKEFVKFLRNHNAYYQFMINLHGDTHINNLMKDIDMGKYETMISQAFAWRTTKEGFKFWLNLSCEWWDISYGKKY